jgi:hypothetical protein
MRIFGRKRDVENYIMRSSVISYSSSNMVRKLKLSRMRWAGHTVCEEDIELHIKTKIMLEVLGRTNRLIPFRTSRTAYKTKKKIQRGYTDKQTAT